LKRPEDPSRVAQEQRTDGAHEDGIRRTAGRGRTHASDECFLLTYPNLPDPLGDVVFRNGRVVLQRFVVGPGQWEGIHSHPGNQLCIHVRGGEWSGREGGEETYSGSVCADGEVEWLGEPIPLRVGHESGNTGASPIEIIWVTLKEAEPRVRDAGSAEFLYPNLPMQLVLENERVIVHQIRIGPGEWVGVHAHSGNQIVVQITGGTWSERRNGSPVDDPARVEPGSVEWVDPVVHSEGHEFGNTGRAPIDQLWITLK